MNSFPSWIHRIPETIEKLALHGADTIDRRTIEEMFDLRKTAACHLLKRMGAGRSGSSFTIRRGLLIARLREAQEYPDWKWEAVRRQAVHERIDNCNAARRKSVVTVTSELQQQMEHVADTGLPDTIRFSAGYVTITCRDLTHLIEQLVLLAKALDTHYEPLREQVEGPHRKEPASEFAQNPSAIAIVS